MIKISTLLKNWQGVPSASSETLKNHHEWLRDLMVVVGELNNQIRELEATNESQTVRISNLEQLSSDQEKIITDQTKKLEEHSLAPRAPPDWSRIWGNTNSKEETIFLAKVSREIKTKENKENNIVISGLNERDNGTAEEKENHDSEELKAVLDLIGINSDHVKRRVRIRKTRPSNKPALLLVEFDKKNVQESALRGAKKLKDEENMKNVFINKDLTTAEREAEKEMRIERDNRNAALDSVGEGRLRYGTENGRQYYWGIRFGEIRKIDKETKRSLPQARRI